MLQDRRESHFDLSELFFSRTCNKGIILSGNTVFQRVSQYEWSELVGKAHNIVRHPDMPRGVFYLFWQYMKNKKPIGAYVKNQSKSGSYYWVFALAMPLEEEIISVRLKPASKVLDIVQKIYAQGIENEKKGLAPEKSAKLILESIKGLGFEGYDDFMSYGLLEEYKLFTDLKIKNAAQNGVTIKLSHRIESLNQMKNVSVGAINLAADLILQAHKGRYVPLNLQVETAKSVDEQSLSLGAIASYFETINGELEEQMIKFNQSAMALKKSMLESQFYICASELQNEMIEQYQFENHAEGPTEKWPDNQPDDYPDNQPDNQTENRPENVINIEHEQAILNQLSLAYRETAKVILGGLDKDLISLDNDCKQIDQTIMSLEIIRITGKIESSRLHNSHLGVNQLLEELKKFVNKLRADVGKIHQMTQSMMVESKQLR